MSDLLRLQLKLNPDPDSQHQMIIPITKMVHHSTTLMINDIDQTIDSRIGECTRAEHRMNMNPDHDRVIVNCR